MTLSFLHLSTLSGRPVMRKEIRMCLHSSSREGIGWMRQSVNVDALKKLFAVVLRPSLMVPTIQIDALEELGEALPPSLPLSLSHLLLKHGTHAQICTT